MYSALPLVVISILAVPPNHVPLALHAPLGSGAGGGGGAGGRGCAEETNQKTPGPCSITTSPPLPSSYTFRTPHGSSVPRGTG